MLFDLNKYTELYLNWGLVFSLIGLALVAWLVYSLIKGIKTGVWKGSKSQYGDSAPIYKREDEPKMFWFCVVFNSTVAFGILFGIFYWIFIGAGVLKANHELFNAVRQVDIEAIEQAIADGANINAMSSGLAPLHLAAIQGQNRISELLIAKGADVNAWSDDGFTPLDGAIMGGTTETAALLRKHGGKTGEELKAEGKLYLAAFEGNIEAVKQHLASGTDVNAKNHLGWTPLHRAAWDGHNDIAELLITAGADVNAQVISGTKKDNTPLDFAEGETADLLRKHGGKTKKELEAAAK